MLVQKEKGILNINKLTYLRNKNLYIKEHRRLNDTVDEYYSVWLKPEREREKRNPGYDVETYGGNILDCGQSLIATTHR